VTLDPDGADSVNAMKAIVRRCELQHEKAVCGTLALKSKAGPVMTLANGARGRGSQLRAGTRPARRFCRICVTIVGAQAEFPLSADGRPATGRIFFYTFSKIYGITFSKIYGIVGKRRKACTNILLDHEGLSFAAFDTRKCNDRGVLS